MMWSVNLYQIWYIPQRDIRLVLYYPSLENNQCSRTQKTIWMTCPLVENPILQNGTMGGQINQKYSLSSLLLLWKWYSLWSNNESMTAFWCIYALVMKTDYQKESSWLESIIRSFYIMMECLHITCMYLWKQRFYSKPWA